MWSVLVTLRAVSFDRIFGLYLAILGAQSSFLSEWSVEIVYWYTGITNINLEHTYMTMVWCYSEGWYFKTNMRWSTMTWFAATPKSIGKLASNVWMTQSKVNQEQVKCWFRPTLRDEIGLAGELVPVPWTSKINPLRIQWMRFLTVFNGRRPKCRLPLTPDDQASVRPGEFVRGVLAFRQYSSQKGRKNRPPSCGSTEQPY